MLLRRITQHVKDQNWFAVALDFVIVVAGIWVALFVSSWSETRQKQADLVQAEQDIIREVASAYFSAHERLALAKCRQARYLELQNLLLVQSDEWVGSPGLYGSGTLTSNRVATPVLRSPSRPWPSQAWDSAIQSGKLDIMEREKRLTLASHFAQAKTLSQNQIEIYRFESRFQALGHTLKLSVSDRLKYYDWISELDALSAGMELQASQIIARVERTGLISFSGDDINVFNLQGNLTVDEFLYNVGKIQSEIYGECAQPINLGILENGDDGRGVTP